MWFLCKNNLHIHKIHLKIIISRLPLCTGSRSTFEFPSRVNLSGPRTSWCNKVDAVRLYASYRLNLLLLKGQRCVCEIILTPNFTNTKIIIYSALFLVIGFLRIISLWKAFVPKKANCTHFANKFALNLKGIYTSGHCQNRLFKILKLMIKWVVIFCVTVLF